MIIKGASVFCEDGTFQVKDVFVEDHKIVATEAEVSDKTVVDANGYKLIPEAFPLMIKLLFSQFIRAFLFVLFLMVIFHALLSGVKR